MMARFENLAIDRVGTDGRVARIALNRPEKMNAFSILRMYHDTEKDRDFAGALRALLSDAGASFDKGRFLRSARPAVHLYFANGSIYEFVDPGESAATERARSARPAEEGAAQRG